LYPSPFFSKNHWGSIITFCVLSLVIHAALVIAIPDFLSIKRIKIIPITYIRPMEVRLRKLPPLPASSKQPSKAKKTSPGLETPQFTYKKSRSISMGKGLFLPPPSLQLPVSEFIGRDTIPETTTSNKKNQKYLGQYTFPSGLPNLIPKPLMEPSSLPAAENKQNVSEKLIAEIHREIQSREAKRAASQKASKRKVKKSSNVTLGVVGPISVRKILYRPPLPKIVAEHSVQIRLKFWVTPNGIVDQVVPIERGGTRMESVAIRFLKRWKFEPLPAEARQERQWGILTVKFLVK